MLLNQLYVEVLVKGEVYRTFGNGIMYPGFDRLRYSTRLPSSCAGYRGITTASRIESASKLNGFLVSRVNLCHL
jgi:hypothetical protein